MNDLSDDALDALLREQFDGPVAADGFCERVMERLPPRRRRIRSWPLVTGVVAGMATGWLSLRSVTIDWHHWLAPEPLPAMTLLSIASGVSVLALLWALAEADDPGALHSHPD